MWRGMVRPINPRFPHITAVGKCSRRTHIDLESTRVECCSKNLKKHRDVESRERRFPGWRSIRDEPRGSGHAPWRLLILMKNFKCPAVKLVD